MIEKPILFSGPMVRAILEGRKSQTRRAVKPQPVGGDTIIYDNPGFAVGRLRDSENAWRKVFPKFERGDRMWVREKARCNAMRGSTGVKGSTITVVYAADRFEIDYPCESEAVRWFPNQSFNADQSARWAPAIFMPRWASRITLEVTEVRVQRLWEITEADAVAEGIKRYENHTFGLEDPAACMGPTAVVAYMRLWNHINGQGSWDANPWVWAYTFKRLEPR